MKRTLFWVVFVVSISCSNTANQKALSKDPPLPGIDGAGYVWTKILDSADWKKSYNFQMLSVRDTLWTFHPDGSWYSTDGSHWVKSSLTNAIFNLAFLDYVIFRDAVFGLGHFEGNIEKFSFRPEIYRTTDFKKWDTISKNSNLPARYFYHPFVFDDKIWIIGGEDKSNLYADIWNSDDGVNWIRQGDNLPFGGRSNDQIVLLNGTLYLIGFDVWSSGDAIHWQKVTDEIVKGQQVSGNAVVFDSKIWLLGCNRNGKFTNGVLSSSDGRIWEAHEAPWSPRGAVAATVYNNKIYMTGGKYGGFMKDGITTEFIYSNDVWTMEKGKQ